VSAWRTSAAQVWLAKAYAGNSFQA